MKAQSRTAKSFKNSSVGLVFYLFSLTLQFFSRKIFLDRLGADVLGLNTTATNLLQFLNLAELGIGAAIACTLYRPLLDGDRRAVGEIVSLQGWMYRRIAWCVLGGGVLLMGLFPWIFAKMTLPLWYAYASFGVLLASALLSYFVNYRQVLLSADQKEYRIQYSYRSAMLVKVLCQILAIRHFDNGYLWWLVLEALFAGVAAAALNFTIRRTYPDLHTDLSQGRRLSRKYPEVITKVRQLFFHKIGGFTLTQTTPVIIYAYASLSLVALYGNYLLILTGITSLMSALFNSMNAGVGNLVAEGDRERIMEVFEELFSARFLLCCTVCFGVYTLTPAFISLWVGPEYLLDNGTLALLTAILYINLSRLTVDSYIYAYGLFSDIWAPIAEAVMNIGLSVLLGRFFGLHGILAGSLCSLVAVIFLWKPCYLFRRGLRVSLKRYAALYARHLAALVPVAAIAAATVGRIPFDPFAGIGEWVAYGALAAGGFFLLLYATLCLLTRGMRDFTHRLIALIQRNHA